MLIDPKLPGSVTGARQPGDCQRRGSQPIIRNFLARYSWALSLMTIFGFSFLVAIAIWLHEQALYEFRSMFIGLDRITGAAALPGAPFLAWGFWGALSGAALGYWLIAPAYQEGEWRPYLSWVPFLAMLFFGTAISLLSGRW